MIRTCYPVLQLMKNNPALWTGDLSLQSIQIFLVGYCHALKDYAVIDTSSFDQFNEWVREKLGYAESTAGWANMILAHSFGINPLDVEWESLDKTLSPEQHRHSIKIFYELVEEFMKEEKNK